MKFKFLLSGLFLLAAAATGTTKPKAELPLRGLCAHRGAMDTHPENTIPAFLEAIRLGAQMIEFDVQLSKDGEMVIMHDASVDRTTDGTGFVSEMTFEEIRRLDAGKKKGAAFAGTRVPTFAEVLAVMPRNIWLNCHLKGDAPVGEAAAKLLEKLGRLDQAFLACNELAADAAQKAVPQVLICNADNKYRTKTLTYANATVARKAQFIQLLRPQPDEDREEVMQLLKKNGVKINFYYARSANELAGLFKQGVDFVLVNNLAEMLPVASSLGIKPVQPSNKQ